MTINDVENFSTTDIALAAYLHSIGFELLKVDESEFPSKFFFSNNSTEFYRYIDQFQCGKATGNVFQFYRSYKLLISKIKDRNGSGRKA